jgi:hypothetical protein
MWKRMAFAPRTAMFAALLIAVAALSMPERAASSIFDRWGNLIVAKSCLQSGTTCFAKIVDSKQGDACLRLGRNIAIASTGAVCWSGKQNQDISVSLRWPRTHGDIERAASCLARGDSAHFNGRQIVCLPTPAEIRIFHNTAVRPAPYGSLSVVKAVHNSTGASTPVAYFVVVQCTPPQGAASVGVIFPSPAHPMLLQDVIEDHSVCLVAEQVPTHGAAPNCRDGLAHWSTTIFPHSVTVTTGHTAQITITNTLLCTLRTLPDIRPAIRGRERSGERQGSSDRRGRDDGGADRGGAHQGDRKSGR